jgi:hypothetical protein
VYDASCGTRACARRKMQTANTNHARAFIAGSAHVMTQKQCRVHERSCTTCVYATARHLIHTRVYPRSNNPAPTHNNLTEVGPMTAAIDVGHRVLLRGDNAEPQGWSTALA